MLTDDGAVRRRRLCAPAACAAVVDQLDAQRSAWVRRGEAFYTLGAATYLDVCGGGSMGRYDTLRARCDPVLAERFAETQEMVRAALEAELGWPCAFDARLARPGFHVFLAGSLNQLMRDQLHLDLQHTHLPLAAGLATPTLTFTLPLETPSGGAGIEFCFATPGEPRGRMVTQDYVLGELLIHSGRVLHRRAHRPVTPACRRITLQGHGVRLGDHWALYW